MFATVLVLLGLLGCSPAADRSATTYAVYAISFANMGDRPLSAFVSGADSSETVETHCFMWLLEGSNGRRVLVDAGFRPDIPSAMGSTLEGYTRPDSAVLRVGVRPDEIEDIIITHLHWDHVDGIVLFSNARVWIQRAEYEYYVEQLRQDNGEHPGIEARDILSLVRLNREGRVTLLDGDNQPIMGGITVYTGPRHTYRSQYVGVNTSEGTVVIASDAAPTYNNIETDSPPTTTLDPNADLTAYGRMRQIASSPGQIIPGHDGAILTKFPTTAEGVVRVAPAEANRRE